MAKRKIPAKTGRGRKASGKGSKSARRVAPAARSAKVAKASKTRKPRDEGPKVRYAVVGLGYFAQVAALPSFAHAKNSRLAALVSDDPEKARKLARKYGVDRIYSYDQYQECLASREVDAVYIALPNDMHKAFAIRAARMGVHVFCEKPMAVTERDCEEMIREANEHDVRLMIGYRLHFDQANLEAMEICNSGKIGEPRFFHGAFTMQVKEGNIRVLSERGGGALYDIGVYCINAARYIFRDEPYEVFAYTSTRDEARFSEVEEMATVLLRFPGERVAALTCSLGAADVATYRVFGTEGDLLMEPAYEYAIPLKHRLTVGGKSRERKFPKRDQIAPEFAYFSECVLKGTEPEPSGAEGLADVRIIRAAYESARTGRPVTLERFERKARPTPELAMAAPPVDQPDLFHAEPPSRD
jgi:glucose-fructose oxidoreductase